MCPPALFGIEELKANGIIKGYHSKSTTSRPTSYSKYSSSVRHRRPNGRRWSNKYSTFTGRGLRETLTGHQNLYVETVEISTADTVRITDAMHNISLSIESSEILRQLRVQPFNHFFFTDPYENKQNTDENE